MNTCSESNNPPMVSVCMITYNHEAFIHEAIEGVLMQKTTFPIELVIGEDCSADNTRIICEEYAQKYPDIVRLLPSEKNIGLMPNFIRTLRACNGKYVALCEGDDFWTDSFKLARQVGFLELNQNFNVCFHDVDVILMENNCSKIKNFAIKYDTWKTEYTFDDLLFGKLLIHTPSVVTRNLVNEFKFEKAVTGDFFYLLHNSFFGKIKMLDYKMAIYRVHSKGVFSQRNSWPIEKKIDFYTLQLDANYMLLDKYCNTKKRKLFVKDSIWQLKNNLRFYYLQINKYDFARKLAYELITYSKLYYNVRFKAILSLAMTLLLPKLFANYLNSKKLL